MRALLLALALLVGAPTLALARPPMETNQIVDGDGLPLGTPANPLTMANPAGAPTATGQSAEIAAIQTRNVTFAEFNGMAIAANTFTTPTTRVASPAYTKFNATAGCDAGSGAILVVRGSNDNFATTIAVAVVSIPANSRNSGSAGASITAPITMAAYHAWIINGSSANTCSLVSSYTVN